MFKILHKYVSASIFGVKPEVGMAFFPERGIEEEQKEKRARRR